MALTVWCLERKKNQNSSAGKQTQGLPIKLRVLYQLSYQGIHVLPLQAKSLSSDLKCVHHMPLQAGDLLPLVEGVASVYKGSSRLFAAICEELSLNDNRWL